MKNIDETIGFLNKELNNSIDENKGRQDNRRIIQSILNIIPDSSLIVSISGQILYFNEIARQNLCNNEPNLKGNNLLNFFEDSAKRNIKKEAKRAILSKKPSNFEEEHNNSFFSVSVYPLLGKEDRVTQLAIFAQDISEKLRIEESEYRKTVQLERLLETSRYLTSSLELNEVLTRISKEGKEILNSYSSTIYLLNEEGDLLIPKIVIDPIYEQEILETPLLVNRSYTGKAVLEKRAIVFNGTNSDIHGFQIPGTTILDNERVIAAPFLVDEKVIGALCLNRLGPMYTEEDLALSETFAAYASIALKNAQVHEMLKNEIEIRTKIEKDLQTDRENLKLINRILQHDLLNNISSLKSALRLYEHSADNNLLKQSHKIIDKSVELINRMRELEIFTLKHKNLKMFNIRKTLNQSIENFKNLKINISGEGTVLAEDSITSVFDNIIRNILMHSGSEKVDIKIINYKNICEIKFIDYGKGIDDKDKKDIFNEGYRFGKTGNSGLGLYIVKKAMESYGGDVYVEDTIPQGATFVLTLKKIT